MNRQQEYANLLAELEPIPPRLETSLCRAKKRAKKRAFIRRVLILPVSTFIVFFIALAATVNFSPAIAHALENVPVLRQIVAAVKLSPSLTAAIGNDFIQRLDLEQTKNGITMRVEYVIVDGRQLNIFYTLDSNMYSNFNVLPSILPTEENNDFNQSLILSLVSAWENQAIRQLTADFIHQMPDSVIFEARVYDPNMYPPALTFRFMLEFDPLFTAAGDIFDVYSEFEVDGQRVTITTVEIYPTHMRINAYTHPENTNRLVMLTFFAENERGERFYPPANGITASGSTETPNKLTFRLESTFFSESESLTLLINEIQWLDKNKQRVRVDLANETAEWLPEGVSLYNASFGDNSWHLSFAAKQRRENHSHQLFHTSYFDENGNEYRFTSWFSGGSHFEKIPDERWAYGYRLEPIPGIFSVEFSLLDFPYDIVYLSPAYSHLSLLDEPIRIYLRVSDTPR